MGQASTLRTHMLLLGDQLSGSGPLAAEAPLTTAAQRFYHILHVAMSAGEHEKVVQVTVPHLQPRGGWGAGGPVLAAFFDPGQQLTGTCTFGGAEPKKKLVDPVLGRLLRGSRVRQEGGWLAGVVWWDLCVCPWGSS